MRELLPDNIALSERLATLPPGLAPPKAPGEREIGKQRELVSSFATYIAIVAEAHPKQVADMLAYIWIKVFHCNQEGLSHQWNCLDTSIHKVFIANQGSKIAILCEQCHEIDHPASKCAVSSPLP